jgi:acyl transferase domain-containing protein/acyl carrier protein
MTSDTAWPTGYENSELDAVEPIAVIGLACRLPGAADVDEFWRNLTDGTESIKRWTLEEQAALGVPEDKLNDPDFVPVSALLAEPEYFDAAFFAMPAREAELRDPQQRLFLELAHTALEDGGYDPGCYAGQIGVYAGSGEDAYQWRHTRRNASAMSAAGAVGLAISSHPDYVATLASYKLNLRGPSLTVHTACSTSLVAVHLACEALRNGECDMALSGGVNIDLPMGRGYVYEDGGVNSRDGHCRAFDADASGTVWGSGGGVVLLKRLGDAVADGDQVRAVIVGNAINNDGSDKVGFTAPSQDGQAAVVTQALAAAQVNPRTITYVEAHGTATALGDPIEVAALSSAYRRHSGDVGWCALGSVKTNVGHLGPSAGVAGLIKAVLAVEHALVPPSLNYQTPNPRIDFGSNPFYVNATLSRWEPDGGPRRAAVSSFGMGGTNAHVILEQAPPRAPQPGDGRPAHLLQLSARTPAALSAATQRLAEHLAAAAEAGGLLSLADVSRTLRTGRSELRERVATVATSLEDAAAALTDPRRLIKGTAQAPPQVALMFPGQGAQYAGMGSGLYRAEPVFRQVVDECAEILRGETGSDIREVLLADDEAAEERLLQTGVAQPALFTVEYALAQLWRSWGVVPAGTIGHSIGEYVAATLAQVFALPDALRVVAARGRLMQAMTPGAMRAVQLDEAECRAMLPDGLSVAAVNGPSTCVVSGPTALVEEFTELLGQSEIASRALRTSHAFHSALMEPMLAEFVAIVGEVPRQVPQIPFLSNVTGDWITSADARDPAYWARHAREPVRFADGLSELLREAGWLLVECGPGRQLSGLARLHRAASATAVPSLPRRDDRASDVEVLYGAAGRLWAEGTSLDRSGFGALGSPVRLPTYPWQREYFWITPESGDEEATRPRRAAAETEPDVGSLFAVPVWRQLPAAGRGQIAGRCLLLADEAAGSLEPALRAAGCEVTRVGPGDEFRRGDDQTYQIRPDVRDDYDRLLASLGEAGLPPRIVHAWAADPPGEQTPEPVGRAQERGFWSLLWLVQALASVRQDEQVVLDVITAGTQDVAGPDLTRPQHATVEGITRVAPQELPWLTARHIDLDPGAVAGGLDAQAVRSLLAELAAAPLPGVASPSVALRNGRRWRREFEQVTVAAEEAGPGLTDRGVYLITGGLGGIGITLAEDLARVNHARLVLVSRSGLPDREKWDAALAESPDSRVSRAIAAVRRMTEAGAEVLVLAADVTSAADLRLVRDEALGRFGGINGIIHAAGLPGGGMAEVKDRHSAQAVLAPKLEGLTCLEQVFGDLDLDFVVLCSSVIAIAGGFGQSDYSAANNFLDAYARGASWRGKVVSVNWGGWQQVGMAAEVAAPVAFRALQRGEVDVSTPAGHPLLQARHQADGEQDWFSGVLSAQTHWVLDDHRIGGVPVLPGTGCLEAARCAAQEAFPAADGELPQLREVTFTEVMSVPDGSSAELRVKLARGAGGFDFEVLSVTAEHIRRHARGSMAYVEPGSQRPVDLAALRARCSAGARQAGELENSASGMLTFGPRWGNLRRVYLGDGEELALVEATEQTREDLDRWVLHPSLLDEATTFGRTPSGHRYLPIGYGQVTIMRPLPARFWSHLRFHESSSAEVVVADVSLLDDDGNLIVAISEFMMRRIDEQAVTGSLAAAAEAAADAERRAAAAAAMGRAQAEPGGGIRPSDGAEAFRRLVAVDLGRQVVISARPPGEAGSGPAAMQELIASSLGSDLRSRRDDPAADGDYVAPRTELEALIARLWADVLGLDRISVTENFFDVGGNSLVAIQVISLVRKETGLRLPMRMLFENPSVEGAAAAVEQARASGPAEGPADGPADGPAE